MRRIQVFILLTIFLSTNVLSQVEIKRVVVDSRKLPLAGAVVTCLDRNDKLLRGSTTDVTGTFFTSADFPQKEWLRVSYLGCENQDFNSLLSLPDTIVMKERSEELGEVVIQGKSIVTQKSDRLVFNIANSNLTKGNNTMQLLRFTPMMRMDNESITMLGKSGIQLYINGKKSNMSESVLQNYLRSLPAEKVERIELITDPGSEYRITTNEGILNLILKKDETQGWKGTLALFDQIGYYNNYGGNLYLDYQKKKFNLSLSSYGLRYHENYQANLHYDYMLDKISNDINQTQRWDYRMGGINVNMDYNLSKNHRIGMIVNVDYTRNYDYLDGRTDYTPLYDTAIDSTVFFQNRSNSEIFVLTSNVNYCWTTDSKGSNMTFDVDYVRSYNELETPMVYTYTTTSDNRRFTQDTDNPSYSYSAKWEYSHVFNKDNRLNVGLEGYYTKNKQKFFYGNFIDGVYVSDMQKTNQFELNESYWAAYVAFNRNWNPKMMTNLGARIESMDREGISKTDNRQIEKDDFSFIPSISLTYNINDDHKLSYTLSSRVIYPYYSLLNPFRFYVSPTVYKENDTNIENSQWLSHSFTYILKQHYIFMMRYMSSGIRGEFHTPAENGYTKISTRTCGNSHTLTGILSWNDSFLKNRLYLNASLTGQFYRAYGHLDEYKIDISDISCNAALDWGIVLSEKFGWKIDGTISYKSKSKGATLNKTEFYSVNLALRKRFENGITLKLGVRHLLHNEHDKSSYFTEDYARYQDYDFHFRKLTIDVTIPFGRKKVMGAAYKSGASSTAKGQLK
ncbi:outer membrane beta-barrel protein [uncultured Phocaeicola sp.]|uniref:outer membrane beta-barrel protein n=1 Tax=uncultured Phocaeicola sp. TaxID=990718 RepID=UPI0014341075|nr:outer membrane beta-barrel protein [uncultured Phocaeicola sp.]GFH97981.1 hypothetical protein IMSAGC004_00365 [Bacteroidaceae bacterium]